MTRINLLQQKIIEMEGGAFQGLCDAYLYKKYHLGNIHSLGAQEGTNKTTIGVPDSYVRHEDGTYTFIMYGHQKSYKSKIENDIIDCLKDNLKKVPSSDIRKIIICHTSTNITTAEDKKFRQLSDEAEIELIGLDTIVQDLNRPMYQGIAKDFLGIKIDSGQIFLISDFVDAYDKGGMTAPLNINFKFRDEEYLELVNAIKKNDVVLVSGPSGVGKSKLVLEVCKKFENENYHVFCVKSNGQSLYDDFTIASSEPGKYLFFLDDINNTTDIRAIIAFVRDFSGAKEIRLVATVRDYEKRKISRILAEHSLFHEKKLSNMTSDQVRKILEESLGITNRMFQDRIVKISKNNIRLAIFAGKSAIKDINNVNDPTGIFKAYYGQIFDEQFNKSSFPEVLLVISLLGTVKINEDGFAAKLLQEFKISWSDFKRISLELHQLEMVDYYLDEIVKVNDQSFKDYILEYSLIEKKLISISRLLELGFNTNRNQIVSTINTLFNIFPSPETKDYLSSQILSQWNKASDDEQDLYLETFYGLDFVKSLSILKNRINNYPRRSFEISEEYFKKKKNYKVINSPDVSILSGYKRSEYFQEAIELIIILLDRRPDFFMDIYFAFEELIYDQYSHITDYEEEYLLLKQIWNLRKTQNKNVDFLLLKIIDKCLMCSGTYTGEGDSLNSIIVGHFLVLFTEGSKKLRSLCWEILSELYKHKNYQNDIHEILNKYHWNGVESDINSIFEFDMLEVKKYFIDTWVDYTFEQSLISHKWVEYAEDLKVIIDDSFKKYESNKDFQYCKIIISNGRFERLSENREKKFKEIKNKTSSYTLEDYTCLFSVAKKLESINLVDTYLAGENLSIIVRNISSSKLVDILTLYFEAGAPFSGYLSGVTLDLLKLVGFDRTYSFINQFDFINKGSWLNTIWTCLPEELISASQITLMLEHIEKEGDKLNPNIPRYSDLLKFLSVDQQIVQKASRLIASLSVNNSEIAHLFLIEFYNKPKELVKVFSKDIDTLEKMYFSSKIDFHGEILMEIIKLDSTFWQVYTKQVDITNFHDTFDKEIFKKVWLLDNYKELIDIAYKNIVAPLYDFYFNHEKHETFFPVDKGQDSIRNDHIKRWVLNFISDNSNDFEVIRKIFSVFVSNQSIEDKIDYIAEFLKYNKNVEDFKKLSLSPLSHFWSGSYVPILDEEIRFWTTLLTQKFLIGLEFIEIKSFIGERIRALEGRKKATLLEEYQDDYLNP
ncbi:ATP-binding protein [Enterococcus hirae]|nr:ATP-binding protein [Enterococcus hirae]MBE8830986.1 ATP-binding protein [Enterococcus hirae]OQO49854.1 hypothetical protein BH735_06995 [Enterococcus hirae]OQO60631.1 hypothetical protein BH740_06545 [Enterococcus hirae]